MDAGGHGCDGRELGGPAGRGEQKDEGGEGKVLHCGQGQARFHPANLAQIH